jgi:hypothetical protein
MPTIIRPNRSRPPPPAIKSSTHLKVLEKMTSSIPSAAAPLPLPRSSSPYLADLLDLDVTVGADDYSPPEPCIPPPAPPSFLLVSSLSAAVAAAAPTLTSSSPPPSLELGVGPDAGSAVALFDYQSSHPGDLNFKVRSGVKHVQHTNPSCGLCVAPGNLVRGLRLPPRLLKRISPVSSRGTKLVKL